jgi:hypothetical protein
MGHTIRPSVAQIQAHIQMKESLKGKEKAVPALQSSVELLPEEALYLLERGSMTIWQGEDEGEFHEEYQGYDKMTEMTALEAFSSFIGMEGLSLERYQVSYRYCTNGFSIALLSNIADTVICSGICRTTKTGIHSSTNATIPPPTFPESTPVLLSRPCRTYYFSY